jgi:hypothetical protein
MFGTFDLVKSDKVMETGLTQQRGKVTEVDGYRRVPIPMCDVITISERLPKAKHNIKLDLYSHLHLQIV